MTRENMRRYAVDRESDFSLLGKEWTVLPGVYPSGSFSSTEFFARQDIYPKPGGTFLEIGCGAGVIAVTAATSGCGAVTATDINPEAVRNTEINAHRHGVAGKVSVRHGDLFDPLEADAEFDAVFWNSNGVEMPGDYRHRSTYERAFFDPGYKSHRHYIEHGLRHVSAGGRLFLGFSGHGNAALLHDFAERAGVTLVERARSGGATRVYRHPHLLLELVRA
ncbi:putative Ribosomal protein L11 methyltransferase [Streptomyces aurantiacus JA 4570]|uniref:Putative Ribosomal protein L11 methyltransferase n=2 Tax=Streptomyces aurantiacus TaxID=47760 RepID=S3ZTD4_9ACTN|nr:putative Ribosomal protein L11 methyltransferase [Streptomyces aurantiacus JA 4570]